MRVFQFPSNGKVDSNNNTTISPRTIAVFQFPSNGKVDSNLSSVGRRATIWLALVSIPFKRESGFKQINWQIILQHTKNVSIPFKRESGFKHEYDHPKR